MPAIVDIASGRIVTNDPHQITLDLSTEWRAFHRPGAPDLYREAHRGDTDEVMELVFRDVNNGVYRCGFAGTQDAYEKAYQRLFDRLDWLSERLAAQRYLVGDTITEADVRCSPPSPVRCRLPRPLQVQPAQAGGALVLWAYARELFQTPGFGDTVDFVPNKRHYYEVHTDINPTQIVPAGPDLSGWLAPHGREALGGRPFGDATPPGWSPAEEVVPPDHTPRR